MEVRTTGVPVIGERELRRAADILRRYKQGKQNLERRIIAGEDWWKLRQWRQFSDKGNPNDDQMCIRDRLYIITKSQMVLSIPPHIRRRQSGSSIRLKSPMAILLLQAAIFTGK